MTRPSRDPTLNTTSSHVHSRLHLHPNTYTNTSVPANASSTAALIPVVSIRNPLNSEDARLLDPSYLSSVPLPPHVGFGGYLAPSAQNPGNPGGSYTYSVPYIDSQGTLHDPDYRPFPLISRARQVAPSPFAVRKPYWELGDEEPESNPGCPTEEDENDFDGSTPNTPTSATPFMRYFLETYPLKHGIPPTYPKSALSRDNYDHGLHKIKKRNKGSSRGPCIPPQLKVITTYTPIDSTQVDMGFSTTHAQEGPTAGLSAGHLITTLSNNSPVTDGVSPGKEKRGWGSLLRKAGKREGGERE